MNKEWYYVVDGERRGPVDHSAIMSLFNAGLLTAETLVWCEGQGIWRPASEVLGVNTPTPPPPVPSAAPVPAHAQPVPEMARTHETTHAAGAEPVFFNVGAGKFILFDIISWGVFEAYWSYRNWKYIRDNEGPSLSPFWRSAFGLLWMYDLMRSITASTTLRAAAVPTHSPGALATGWVIGTILCRIGNRVDSLAFLVLIGWVICLLCLMPLRGFISQANASMSPRRGDSRTGAGLVLVLLIGAVLWVLAFALPGTEE